MTRREETLKEYLELIYRKNKYVVIVVALVILVFSVFIGLTISTNVNDKKITEQEIEVEELETVEQVAQGETENQNTDVFVASDKLVEKKVYIAGEVNNPGVYSIHEGDRIEDIIKYAGGVTDEAYLQNVNLSRIVDDEEHIIIPTKDDEYINTIDSNVNTKININKATKEELTKITGVGETTAESIITYRTTVGKFTKIEDIKKVSGIGNKTFEKMKDQICV